MELASGRDRAATPGLKAVPPGKIAPGKMGPSSAAGTTAPPAFVGGQTLH
jgi:hypothetical protein